MKKPDFNFITDNDTGLMEIYVDGILIVTWCFEEEPEDVLEEFKKVFYAGLKYGKYEK